MDGEGGAESIHLRRICYADVGATVLLRCSNTEKFGTLAGHPPHGKQPTATQSNSASNSTYLLTYFSQKL